MARACVRNVRRHCRADAPGRETGAGSRVEVWCGMGNLAAVTAVGSKGMESGQGSRILIRRPDWRKDDHFHSTFLCFSATPVVFLSCSHYPTGPPCTIIVAARCPLTRAHGVDFPALMSNSALSFHYRCKLQRDFREPLFAFREDASPVRSVPDLYALTSGICPFGYLLQLRNYRLCAI